MARQEMAGCEREKSVEVNFMGKMNLGWKDQPTAVSLKKGRTGGVSSAEIVYHAIMAKTQV